MSENEQAAPVHWIDHYTIPTNDLDASVVFFERALGMKTDPSEKMRMAGRLFQQAGTCRHGLFVQDVKLPPREALGEGFPRYAWFVRDAELSTHLRRFEALGIEHSSPQRVVSEGETGTAVYWYDNQGNQFELWAPDHPPAGAFEAVSATGIGRISHAVYASRDLDRTARFFKRYCKLSPFGGTSPDTLVLPLAAGGRLIFKLRPELGKRCSGPGIYFDLHAALVVAEDGFWASYERVWRELPEWTYSFGPGKPFEGEGSELPPRTMEHASPAGMRWKAAYGRGDDWLDWDGNLFHFYGGAPVGNAMTTYQPHPIEDYMEAYLRTHPSQVPSTVV